LKKKIVKSYIKRKTSHLLLLTLKKRNSLITLVVSVNEN